jgi:hypothetical protein
MTATETFANDSFTVVLSGGTDLPAQGTIETWTVSSSASFPVVSSSTPPSQFHVADQASPSEIIAVTNTSGNTWTVTRGAENTTPVGHLPDFTIYQVATAGWLGPAAAQLNYPPGDSVMQLMIPMYIYPSYFDEGGGAWQQVQSSAPATSIIIANVSNGPGNAVNGDFTTQIPLAQAAGIKVLGYVSTNYTTVPTSTVTAQVDSWYDWYTPDGIFFDEATNTAGADQAYYQSIYNYVKAKPYPGQRLVAINPGSPTDVSYMTACDIVCDFEEDANTFINTFTPETWAADYPASRFCRTINQINDGITLGQIIAKLRADRTGYFFITTNAAYSSLPADPYWNGQLYQASSYNYFPVLGAQSDTAQTVTDNGTISTSGLGVARVSPSSAVTGVILPAGTAASQQLTVINEASYPVAFATSGTSNVADGTADIIAASTAHSFVWDSAESLWYASGGGSIQLDWLNAVTQFGADPTGTTDSTTAINNALASVSSPGGTVYLPAGIYKVNTSTALALSTAGTVIRGDGPNASLISIGSSFGAAEAVSVNAISCSVQDLGIVGASSTVTSNPACNGIELNGYAHCRFKNLWFQYVNGWGIEAVGGSSAANVDLMIGQIVSRNCAAGIHVKGVTGSSFLGEHFLTDIQLQQVGASSGANENLDALLIEDISDVLVQGVNIGIASGTTGSALHIKGACATVAITNPDVGANQSSGSSAALHIESSTNGSPSGITINGGSVEGGNAAIQVDAGSDVTLNGVRSHQAYGDGLQVNNTPEVLVIGCSFAANNQGGGTAYDVNCSGMTGGNFRAVSSRLETAIGTSTAGEVPNSVNASTHAYFKSCFFIATGGSPSNVFTGTPQQVTECIGYNPRGSVTVPNGGTAGTSPYTPAGYQTPLQVVFSSVGGMTQFQIGTTALANVPAVGVPITIGVRQAMVITWTGTAPTWQWFGL